MSMKNAVIATAVASLFASGAVLAKEKTSKKTAEVKCAGVNECKGHGGCKSATNACKGQNGCKGTSFETTKTAKECEAKGGKVMASNDAK
jgi:hypothetical protein